MSEWGGRDEWTLMKCRLYSVTPCMAFINYILDKHLEEIIIVSLSYNVKKILFCVSRYVIFDTPGQIEVFTWSASGSIITESLVSQQPVNSTRTIAMTSISH